MARWGDSGQAWRALPKWARDLYRTAFKNALARGTPFDLSRADFAALVSESGDRCAVSGLPFVHERTEANIRRPFAPSLDRKDSALGYTRANCRFVSIAVNFAMNAWGERVLIVIAAAVAARNRDPRAYADATGYARLPGVESSISKGRGLRFRAKAMRGGRRVWLGTFDTEEAAHAAHLRAGNDPNWSGNGLGARRAAERATAGGDTKSLTRLPDDARVPAIHSGRGERIRKYRRGTQE